MASSSDRFSTARREKDFTLYTHGSGPNGWKIAHCLQELDLEYESIFLDFPNQEHKSAGNFSFHGGRQGLMLLGRVYEIKSQWADSYFSGS
jgi:Glutathione S-transferase, N-terminal domain